jgi:hypothetical protein
MSVSKAVAVMPKLQAVLDVSVLLEKATAEQVVGSSQSSPLWFDLEPWLKMVRYSISSHIGYSKQMGGVKGQR